MFALINIIYTNCRIIVIYELCLNSFGRSIAISLSNLTHWWCFLRKYWKTNIKQIQITWSIKWVTFTLHLEIIKFQHRSNSGFGQIWFVFDWFSLSRLLFFPSFLLFFFLSAFMGQSHRKRLKHTYESLMMNYWVIRWMLQSIFTLNTSFCMLRCTLHSLYLSICLSRE